MSLSKKSNLDKRWEERCNRLRVAVTPYPDYHLKHCRTYKAANGPVAIACAHNFDCCPKCDPCTCYEEEKK